MAENNQVAPPTNQQVATSTKFDKNTFDAVMVSINDFLTAGSIKIPGDYSAENACRSAFLMLQDQLDRSDKPVLVSCTKESVANALLKMVIQGMNPVKGQCYFIPYGNQLTYQRSYMGAVALAKRVSNLKDIKANAIYQEDVFEYEINAETGRKKITKHEQDLKNVDPDRVKGAYAIKTLEDGTIDVEIMNMIQIRKSWDMGKAKGASKAHQGFADEMACKTVINRACKLLINSSDDSELMKDDSEKGVVTEDTTAETVQTTIKENANKREISIDKKPEPKKEGYTFPDAIPGTETATPQPSLNGQQADPGF